MKIKGRFVIILFIIIILGTFIQMTRLNLDMDHRTNRSILEIGEGEKIDTSLLDNIKVSKILVVSREIDGALEKVENNILKTLSYMQKEYDVILAGEFSDINVEDYESIIFNIYNLDEIARTEEIISFIKNGGSVLFTSKLENNYNLKRLYSVIGIENIEGEVETEGIKLKTDLLIKGNGVEIKEDIRVSNISDNVKLKSDSIIHITDSNDLPLLWENDFGDGKVFYFNGSMFNEKSNRGILAAIFSSFNNIDIYPIMNTKINFIDDFPSPIPDGTSEEIYEEYGLSIRRFYKEVWWPDMLKSASSNNMKYTGVFIGTYDDETYNLSKSNIDIENNDFNYYARELLSVNGELGVHGYNHQPLVLYDLKDKSLGYKAWKDKEAMIEGVRRLVEFSKEHLKNYNLNVYVPPSNITSKEGIEVVRECVDGLKIVSASYDAGEESESYIQEVEIDENGVYNLPRLTYEFEYTEESKWDIIGGVNLMGYISHFVHPDDILDVNRNNGKTWTELGEEYFSMNKDIYYKYPWITATTATEAAKKLEVYQNTKIYIEKDEKYINLYCDNYTDEVSLILKTDKGIGKLENCTVTKIGEGAYWVIAKSAISKINLY